MLAQAKQVGKEDAVNGYPDLPSSVADFAQRELSAKNEMKQRNDDYSSSYASGCDAARKRKDLLAAEQLAKKAIAAIGEMNPTDKANAEELLKESKLAQQDYANKIIEGKRLLAAHEPEKARDVIKMAKNIWPSAPDANGVADLHKQADQDALEKQYNAEINKGDDARKAQSWDEAKKHYKQALDIKPQDTEAQYGIAMAEGGSANAKKHLDDADKAYARALNLKPADLAGTRCLSDVRIKKMIGCYSDTSKGNFFKLADNWVIEQGRVLMIGAAGEQVNKGELSFDPAKDSSLTDDGCRITLTPKLTPKDDPNSIKKLGFFLNLAGQSVSVDFVTKDAPSSTHDIFTNRRP